MDLSDHGPIYLGSTFGEGKRSTYWRLNTSLLFTLGEVIRKDIKDYLFTNNDDQIFLVMLWDALKAIIKEWIVRYSSNLKRKINEQLKILQTQLKKIKKITLKKLQAGL